MRSVRTLTRPLAPLAPLAGRLDEPPMVAVAQWHIDLGRVGRMETASDRWRWRHLAEDGTRHPDRQMRWALRRPSVPQIWRVSHIIIINGNPLPRLVVGQSQSQHRYCERGSESAPGFYFLVRGFRFLDLNSLTPSTAVAAVVAVAIVIAVAIASPRPSTSTLGPPDQTG